MDAKQWLESTVIDKSMPEDTIELRDPNTGELLVKVVNVGTDA